VLSSFRSLALTIPFIHKPLSAQEPKHSHSFWYRDFHHDDQRGRFAFHVDTYGGAILSLTEQERAGLAIDEFRCRLDATIKYMQSEGLNRGLWVTLDKSNVHVIPALISEYGFDFHHAERDTVTLAKWLPAETRPNTLPGSVSHTVGVGAVVVRRGATNRQVLLVQEQSGPAARLGVWKLPTGLLEPGEDIVIGVAREVREETGLEDLNFRGILLMRHGHQGAPYLGGNSDLFFVCVLEATGEHTLKLQETEIKDAKWVDAEKLLDETKYTVGTSAHLLMQTVHNFLDDEGGGVRAGGRLFQGHQRPSWRPDAPHTLFYAS
jgi:ADP-ribose pyrophosphatase YjhB (NUDIX family)